MHIRNEEKLTEFARRHPNTRSALNRWRALMEQESCGTAKMFVAEYQLAITDFDEAIHLKPEFVEAYYNRGLTKFTLNQSEAAEHDLRTALKLAKQHEHNNIKVNIKQRLQELNNIE